VFAGYLKPAKAKDVKQLVKEYGKQLTVLPMDMSSEAAIKRASTTIRRKTKRVDLLINCAGVFWNDGAEKVNFRDFTRMFVVNTFGPAVLIREMLLPLRTARGAIVNISSEAGSQAGVSSDRPILAYGASKAALNGLTRRFSFILAKDGIRVISVHPGWMRTPMGGDNAQQEPSATARDVFALADKLDAKMSGGFFNHDGSPYPW